LTALLEASRAVTLQSTPGAAATTAAEKLETLLSADRALCYYVAGQPDRLVIADRRHDLDAEHPAHRGLCGFVARAGTLVQASPARSDPRYVQALDNPLGREDDHLLLVPIVGEDGRVFGVLAAARASNRVGFSEDEIEVATTFALHVVSIFRELDLRSRVNEVIHDRGRHFRGQAAQLFRLEAIEHSEQGRRYGDLLELDDRWSTWGKYVLVSLFIFLPFALSVARVHDTATGPAIIRGERAEEVVAPVDGMVADVLVEEGERVTVGQPLLQLATQEELAELRRAESEWKGLLLRRLEDPRDSAAQQRLVAVRAELQRAREIVHMRTIAARQDGVVRAIPRKPGELVRQGTVVASIQATDAGGFVEATISSNFRPLVQEGIWLDVELSDFQTAHVLLQVSEISEQALGPNEVRQLLWSEDQDSPATSPRLLLRAPLTTDTFEYDGEHFRLREGMTGVARVRLRSKPAIFKLLPALEEAFGD
jgi:multidrug efflux pump subunit AcrA (membrane-fusion protein)